MASPPRIQARARLGTRLLGLFIAAALLPVIASDWLSVSSTQRVARGLGEEHRSRQVRQASRQVLDRLLSGKTVLVSMLQTGMLREPPSSATVRGTRVFLAVAPADAAPSELLAAWNGAARSTSGATAHRHGPASASVTLSRHNRNIGARALAAASSTAHPIDHASTCGDSVGFGMPDR